MKKITKDDKPGDIKDKVEGKEIVPEEKVKPLILSPEIDTETVKDMVELAEKQVDYVKRIKLVSIKVTNHRDWISQDGNPYLEVSGTMKMNQLWGVSIKDQIVDTQTVTDEKGTYKVIMVSGRGLWRGYEITEIGTCTTRDQLFSKAYGQDKKQEDVSLENVIKAAATNFHNRLMKKILGLKFTWEDLIEAGLDVDKIKERKVEHAKPGEAVSDKDKKRQIEMGKMIKEMYPDNAPDMLAVISAFTMKDKKTGEEKSIPGKRSCGDLVGTRLRITHDKVKEMYDKWVKEQK